MWQQIAEQRNYSGLVIGNYIETSQSHWMALFVPSPFEIDTVYIIGLEHEMTRILLKVLSLSLWHPQLLVLIRSIFPYLCRRGLGAVNGKQVVAVTHSLLVSARCFLCPRPAIRRVAPICRWLGPSLPGTSGTWSLTRDSVQPGIRRGLYTVHSHLWSDTGDGSSKERSKVYPSTYSISHNFYLILVQILFLMIHAL